MTRPVHFEICSHEPERLANFYENVLGWEFAVWEGARSYWLARTGEIDLPGIDGAIMHKYFKQSVINTVEVASLEETLEKIQAHGGRMVYGPNQIPGIGLHAYCEDPEGILFGVLQPLQQ